MILRPRSPTLFPYTTLFRSTSPVSASPSHSSARASASASLCSRWTMRFSSIERSEEHTSELQSREKLVCRLLLEKKDLGCSAVTQIFRINYVKYPTMLTLID